MNSNIAEIGSFLLKTVKKPSPERKEWSSVGEDARLLRHVADWSRTTNKEHSSRDLSDVIRSPIHEAIEDARWIVGTAIDPEDEHSAVYVQAMLSRAAAFLRDLESIASRSFGAHLVAPRLNPGDDGGIDLFWDLGRFHLLLSLPATNTEPITYYGSNSKGESLGGVILPESMAPEVVAWIVKQ
jgi:hypothetical protein